MAAGGPVARYDVAPRDGRWNRLIDETRIAMVGHSVGGQSAAHLLPVSRRIRAVVNLDGPFPGHPEVRSW